MPTGSQSPTKGGPAQGGSKTPAPGSGGAMALPGGGTVSNVEVSVLRVMGLVYNENLQVLLLFLLFLNVFKL